MRQTKKFEARNHPMLMNEIKCWASKTNAKIISIDPDENSLNRVTARVVYEIEEPEYYWKFNELKGFNKCDLYFGITLDIELLLIDVATLGTAKKCTKSELNDYLLDTNLTTDNFTPVEAI